MTRNALHWLTEEYLAFANVADVVGDNGPSPARTFVRKPLLNEGTDGRWICCGGMREHFAECKELCCFCGQPRAWSGWNSTYVTGPNGFPAHPGCVEDDGWAHMQERPHDDEAMDVPESALYDQDEL